jgi:hypothetical protein
MTVTGEPEPRELLDLADGLLTEPPDSMAGRWPRAVAILTRQALEMSLDRLWARTEPPVASASMRAQLLCLPRYLDPALAGRTSVTWHELSRACHHHAYELPPTAVELAGWLETTDELRRAVEARRTAA